MTGPGAKRYHRPMLLAEAVSRAIAAERLRAARTAFALQGAILAFFNAYDAYALFYLHAHALVRQSVQNAGWALLLGLVWLVARKRPALLRRTPYLIPVVDIPIFIWILYGRLGGIANRAALPFNTLIILLLFIMIAQVALDARVLWATLGASLCAVTLVCHLVDAPIVPMWMYVAIAGVAVHHLPNRIRTLAEDMANEEVKRGRLGRYFSPQVSEHIMTNETSRIAEHREVTILFSDVRGFTALSEELSSSELAALLDDYLARMVHVLYRHGGTLDKFMGDGILAYFGAPVAQSDHPARAIACAREMLVELAALTQHRLTLGGKALKRGIGIHTGCASEGVIGPPERREYTVIGDAVNTASRVEGLTKEVGAAILITAQTRALIDDELPWVAAPPLPVRGKREPLQTYALDEKAALGDG